MTHSFPTRRSSDLIEWPLCPQIGIGEEFATVGRLRGEAAARCVEGVRRISGCLRHCMAHRGVVHPGHRLLSGGRLFGLRHGVARSEEHTSELQSLMRISYAVFCLKKKTHNT